MYFVWVRLYSYTLGYNPTPLGLKSYVFEHTLTVSGPMESAINARADAVSSLGVYWGIAEWSAWGWVAQTKPLLLFGCNVVCIFAVFAPGLDVCPEACAEARHVLGVARHGGFDLFLGGSY